MKTTLSHRFSWFVIVAFTFQTIWPSWVMASETETVPPFTSLRSPLSFNLQTFIDEGAGGDDFTFSAKHSLTIPKYGSAERTQYFLNQSLDVKAFYPGLKITEAGFSWSQYGFNFLLNFKEHLFVAASSAGLPISSQLRIYNPNGNIILGEGLALEHLLLKGQSVFHIGSRSKIDQLDVWATGTSKGSGAFQNSDKASLAASKVSIHDGNAENFGYWSIAKLLDLKGHNFTSHSEFFFSPGAVLDNVFRLKNFGRFTGSDYRALTHYFHNIGDIEGSAVGVVVQKSFENKARFNVTSQLSVGGSGTFLYTGSGFSTPRLIIDTAEFRNLADWHQDQLTVKIGAQTIWKNKKDLHTKLKKLILAKSDIETLNEGDLEVETFVNHRDTFRNQGAMTHGQWEQLGKQFINESGASVEVSGTTVFDTDKIENQGDIILGGPAQGRIGDLMNQNGGFVLKSDATLTGTNLTNTKLFKTEKAFTWSGQTVENKGKMVANGKTSYKAKSFTSTKDSSFTAEQLFSLYLEEDLALYGNWILKQGALVNAPTIGTFGRFEVPGGETTLEGYFTNYGFGHIAHLILKKGILTNDGGRLLIQKLTNLSSKKLCVRNLGKDESKKTKETKAHLAVQGGFEAERVDNTGQLTLDSGIYGIKHFYNHDEKSTGTAEIDRLSLLADSSKLYGEILIHKYIHRSRLQGQDFTINGSVTLLEGHLWAESVRLLSSRSHLTLGSDSFNVGSYRGYENHSIKTLEILEGIFTALPGMRIQTESLQNLGGVIESATSLRVAAVEEGTALKNEISSNDSIPSITVTNLQASNEEEARQAELGKRVILGVLRAQKDIKLEFSKFLDSAESLFRHGNDWQCNGLLYLFCEIFRQTKDIELARRLSLNVVDFSSISRLSVSSITLLTDSFRLGLSNDRMGMIETMEKGGKLHISVKKEDVHLEYGQLRGSGPVKVDALVGDILFGQLKATYETSEFLRKVCGIHPDPTVFYRPNDAFIAGMSFIDLQTPKTFRHYGEIAPDGPLVINTQHYENVLGRFNGKDTGEIRAKTMYIGVPRAVWHDSCFQEYKNGHYVPNTNYNTRYWYMVPTSDTPTGEPGSERVLDFYFEKTLTLHAEEKGRLFARVIGSGKNVFEHNIDHESQEIWHKSEVGNGTPGNVNYPSTPYGQGSYHTVTPHVLSGETVTRTGKSHQRIGYVSAMSFTLEGGALFSEFLGKMFQNLQQAGIHSTNKFAEKLAGVLNPRQSDGTHRARFPSAQSSSFSVDTMPVLNFKLGKSPKYSLFCDEKLMREAFRSLYMSATGFVIDRDGNNTDAILGTWLGNSSGLAREGRLSPLEILRQNFPLAFLDVYQTPEGTTVYSLSAFFPESMINAEAGRSETVHTHKGSHFTTTEGMYTDGLHVKSGTVANFTTSGGDMVHKAPHIEAKEKVDFTNTTDSVRILSTTTRHGNGANFRDDINQGTVISEEITGYGAQDFHTRAIHTKSGKGGTKFKAVQQRLDEALALESQSYNQTDTGHTKTRSVRHHLSQNISTGVVEDSGYFMDLFATQYDADQVVHNAGKGGLRAHNVHDSDEVETVSESKKKGAFGLGSSKQTNSSRSFDARSKGMKIKAKKTYVANIEGDATYTGVDLQVPKTIITALDGIVRFNAGINYSSSSRSSSRADLFWQSMSQHMEEHQTYTPNKTTGDIEIYSKETIVQVDAAKDQMLRFYNSIKQNGGKLSQEIITEIHKVESHKAQGPSMALSVVIALAVSIATQGTGTALGGSLAGGLSATGAISATGAMATAISGMTAATFTALCSKAALAVLNNQGDIGRAAKSLLTKETLKSLGVDAAIAGLTGGGAKPSSFVGHFAQQANKALYRGLVEKVVYGRTDEKEIALGALSGAVGATISADIGSAHYNGEINGLAHKALHAVSGGIQGLIQRGEKGIAAGALGASIAETVADVISPTGGLGKLDPKDRPVYSAERVQLTQDVARLTASMAALLAGMDEKDIAIAISTATVAVENNFAASAEKASEGQDEAETKEAEDPELTEIEEELSYLNHLKSEAGEFERPMTPRTLAARKAYVECERELLVANEKQRFAYQQMGITPESRANSAYLEAQVKVGDALLLRSLKGEILSPYENEVKRDYVLQRTFGFAMDIASSRFGLGGTVLKRTVRANQTPSAAGILESGGAKSSIIGPERQLSKPRHTPYAGGVQRSFVTIKEETYYRVYSQNSTGAFLTKVKPKSSNFAKEGLALHPGNSATFVQEVIVPKGIILQRSRAVPAFGKRGGLEQFEVLLDKKDLVSKLVFKPGELLK